MKKLALATVAAGAWINLSEFVRNEWLFKQFWLEKYQALGIDFPSAPVNGALWAVWGFGFAACLVVLIRRLSIVETVLVGWACAFALMWIVTWNLGVLPPGLLPVAVPWSLAETALAVFIAQRIVSR